MQQNEHYSLRQEGKVWVASLMVPDQWDFGSARTQGLIKQKATVWRSTQTAKNLGYGVTQVKDKTGGVVLTMRRY